MPPISRPLRVVVVARLDDAKLASKVAPLVGLPGVGTVHVVRRTPLPLAGITNHCPPVLLRRVGILAELWRLAALLLLAARERERTVLVGIFLVPHGAFVEIARRLLGARTIQMLIGEEDLVRALETRFFFRAVRRAVAVGVRGERTAERLVARGIPEDRIFSPPNVFDSSPYAADPSVVPDIDVLYVGALVQCKRVDVLLDALARVRERRPSLQAAIVGDGDARARLERQAAALGLAERARFAGRQDVDGVVSWLRRSRLFVMTSELEGLPMAMVEAMSCGLPVIVTDVGDVTTVARHLENAWVVARPDPDEVATAIDRLLQDDPLRRRLAKEARRTAEDFARRSSMDAARAAWRLGLGA